MKKTLVALLALLMACSILAGCGVKKKIEQKVTEKLVETVIEESLGGSGAKVDISEDGIIIKDNEGGTFTLGTFSWPSSVDYIPEFTAGSIITASTDADNNLAVIFEKVEQEDFEAYMEKLKPDFSEEVTDAKTEDAFLYQGKNANGDSVLVQYFINDKTMAIYTKRNTE